MPWQRVINSKGGISPRSVTLIYVDLCSLLCIVLTRDKGDQALPVIRLMLSDEKE